MATTTKKKRTTKKTAAKKATKKTTKKAPAKKATKKVAAKKTTAKKATLKTAAKKTTAKKTTAKKATSKKSKNVSVGKKPFTKTELMSALAEETGLSKKDVGSFLEKLCDVISAHVSKSGPGVFSWPGMLKIEVKHIPATKARKGTNPFTGETMMFKAKPARKKVKIRALKALKEMVS